MKPLNPAGTEGFDFLEFTTLDPQTLQTQFTNMGLTLASKHRVHDITIFQQNNIRFIINLTPSSHAREFAEKHGPSVCAMGFRVHDANIAYEHALKNGGKAYLPDVKDQFYGIPAIYGVGGSIIYLVDYKNNVANYAKHFLNANTALKPTNTVGMTYIDHVTHNLYRGNMDEWADFYTRLFNFKEVRYFDIEGRMTGLKSRAMTSPCGRIRIPLNESADNQSQIEEFLHAFNGEGIQHIALGTDNIYQTVEQLKNNHLDFLDTPDTYYELIEQRLPKHGESLEQLKKLRILIDGEIKTEKKILLQIFTQNMLGPVFFEIIQRKGDEGFGEGNFRALFESIELDQIRRGVIKETETL